MPKDPFIDTVPTRNPLLAGIAFLVIASLFSLFCIARSGPTRESGVVESIGAISVAGIQGGTQRAASVRLANGALISAAVQVDDPLAPGDHVRLLHQRSIIGTSSYALVGREAIQ